MPETLEELKRKNEQEAAAKAEAQEQANVSDENASEQSAEAKAEESSSEAWLTDGEPEEQTTDSDEPEVNLEGEDSDRDEKKDRTVPMAKHIDVRQQLKGRLRETKDENQQLKDRIATLEQSLSGKAEKKPAESSNVQSQKFDVGAKPKRADFDNEDDFLDARDEWRDKKRLAESNQAQREAQLLKQKETVEKSVSDHYDRASKLVEKHNIDPSAYQSADKEFRQALDDVHPGKGEVVADALISMIGDDSEKLVFYVGRSKERREQLARAIADDPVGVKASMLLGTWKGELKAPGKRTTNAPAPMPNLHGETKPTSNKQYKRKYDDAHKKGDIQTAFNMKRAAKQAGVDVSQW